MSEHTYYVVVYNAMPNGNHPERKPQVLNQIVRDVHPLVWLSRPTEWYDEHYCSFLLFFTEIPENVALDPDVGKYFGLPDLKWGNIM